MRPPPASAMAFSAIQLLKRGVGQPAGQARRRQADRPWQVL
ncbi:hypothetical protein [Mesorhizobium sp. B2-4-17]|nr:hypothetical protein [Mesorhizobium sp. B2-4-17]